MLKTTMNLKSIFYEKEMIDIMIEFYPNQKKGNKNNILRAFQRCVTLNVFRKLEIFHLTNHVLGFETVMV